MELIIKLSQDHPSRIGVKYVYEHQAIRAYEEFFTKQTGTDFSLRIEPTAASVNLTLISEESGARFYYKQLEYKFTDLKKLEHLSHASPLQFVHIFPKSNALFVAKPFKKELFIRIASYEIIHASGFSDVM